MSRTQAQDFIRTASQTPDDRGSLAAAARRALARTVATFREWRRLSRSRRELAALDEFELKDLGLSRSQAQFESNKSFLQH
jgi:uncharacterized protein YjiS (DUF1127 family)